MLMQDCVESYVAIFDRAVKWVCGVTNGHLQFHICGLCIGGVIAASVCGCSMCGGRIIQF